MDSPIDLVTSTLEKVVGPVSSTGNWRCPSHEDSTASLTVSNGEKGVLITCHAGCDLESILSELQLEPSDLFNVKTTKAPKDKPVITDIYDYVDEDGNLVFQVLRRFPKSFLQRRPDPTGGWIYSLEGVSRPLYRLPQVLAAIDFKETVWLVEGEKDVAAAESVGLTATTKSSGAKGWLGAYTKTLQGATVHIVADADEPGRKYAADVKADLLEAGCTVRLFEAAVGKDLADHLGAGKRIDELVEIVDEIQPEGLPLEFWNHTQVLKDIRQFAHASYASPDALLGALLARIASIHRYDWLLDTTFGSLTSLSMYAALVGRSGTGKSVATALARELLPLSGVPKTRDGVAVGSGEGLVESYLALVDPKNPDPNLKVGDKYQKYSGIFATMDEGQKLEDHIERRSSTLMETLRTMWTGSSDPGQTNASIERSRSLKPSSYSIGLVVGIQPEHANAILSDAAGGTPQRFVWFGVLDPSIPRERPPRPKPLGWHPPTGDMQIDLKIIEQWEEEKYRIATGELLLDPLDSHRTMCKVKVAALLEILHSGCMGVRGEQELLIDQHVWDLAEMVMEASDRTRGQILAQATERQQRARKLAIDVHVEKELSASTAIYSVAEQRALASSMKSVERLLQKSEHGRCTRTDAARAMSSRNKSLVSSSDVLQHMLDEGLIRASTSIRDRGCVISLKGSARV